MFHKDSVDLHIPLCFDQLPFDLCIMFWYSLLKNRPLPLDVYQWDVRRLPLRPNSVDVIVSDLPFGKKSGSKHENWTLYRAALKELARVCPPEKGRAVLLTQDKRVMAQMLKESDVWKKKWVSWINMGGLQSGVYVLGRTAKSVFEDEQTST